MKLVRKPAPPRGDSFYLPYSYQQIHTQWQKYLPQVRTSPPGAVTPQS
jgi:hypothetical protein